MAPDAEPARPDLAELLRPDPDDWVLCEVLAAYSADALAELATGWPDPHAAVWPAAEAAADAEPATEATP